MMKKRPLFAVETRRAKPKKKWRIHYVLWTALKKTCMVFGALMLVSIIITSFSMASFVNQTAKPLPDKIVLVYNAKTELVEEESSTLSSALMPDRQTLRGLLDALDKGRTDDRVKGFVTVLKHNDFRLSHIYELREAVQQFRDSGKFAYIFAPSYGAMGRGLGVYYLASAFDEIWLQPIGTVSISGIRMEIPFARELIDKIGVEPQFEARKEYKSVFENFTNTEMSPKNREALTSLIDDLADYMTGEISLSRAIDPKQFKEIVDKGILLPAEALEAGLIDHIDYVDRLESRVNEEVTGVSKPDENILVSVASYIARTKKPAMVDIFDKNKASSKPGVGLVYISGALVGHRQRNSSSASDIYSAIGDAASDKNIDVIVLRINSPGGTPVAAETIRRAVMLAQEKNNKVLVSMGGMAASAGYWIAAPADRIFATPLTITGSIGVAGGKFNMRGMWDKIGVNWEAVQWGNNADMFSMNEPFTEAGRKRFSMLIDKSYENFIGRVASGRNMSLEEVEEVARGRPWTGRQASKKGLVDELGGLNDVLDYAAKLSKVNSRHDVDIQIFPRPKKPIDQLLEFLNFQSSLGGEFNSKMLLLSLLNSVFGDFLAMTEDGVGIVSYETLQVGR